MLTNLLKRNSKEKTYETELAESSKFNRSIDLFNTAIEQIELQGKKFESLDIHAIKERQQCFAEGYVNIVRKSLFYDYVLDCFGAAEVEIPDIYPGRIADLPQKTVREFNLRDRCILVNYRKPWAVAAQIQKIKGGETVNGESYTFFQNLGIGFVRNGNHRIIAAMAENKDIIAKEVCLVDDQWYLDTLTTDGQSWYKKSKDGRPVGRPFGDESLGEVFDYRIALIFEIVQKMQKF